MYKILIALAVLPLAACSEGVTFDLTSTMEAQTRGVAMFNWNEQGIAGMAEQTCSFDIGRGVVLGDLVDLPGSDDTVVDSDGSQALVTSGGGLWQVSDWGDVNNVNTPDNVVDAAFTMDGITSIVSSDETCGVHYADWSDSTIALRDFDCSSAVIEAGRETGMVFVADGSRVLRVDRVVTEQIESNADLLAWDDAAGVLVIANSQGSDVRGIDSAGNVEWTVAVDGIVDSIDTLGWESRTLVSFTKPDGSAEIVVLNSNSGDTHANVEVPETVTVIASPDGVTVALDDGDAVHFYDVDPRSAALGVPSVQPSMQPTFGD